MLDTEEKETIVVLVITDGIFGNQCEDSAAYVKRLKEVIGKNRNRIVSLTSVVGSRGISDIDSTIPTLDLDTKNKTQFVQSLENNISLFDELLIIREADDLFLSGARQAVTELNKPLCVYGYPRKNK